MKRPTYAPLTLVAAAVALAISGCDYDDPPTAYVGDCFHVSALVGVVDEIPTVPCELPHEAEVYATFDLDYEGPYVEVPVRAEYACIMAFEEFVGVEIFESELDVYYLHPVEEVWEQGGRETICSVIAPDWETSDLQLIEGSLRDSGR